MHTVTTNYFLSKKLCANNSQPLFMKIKSDKKFEPSFKLNFWTKIELFHQCDQENANCCCLTSNRNHFTTNRLKSTAKALFDDKKRVFD